MALDFGSPGFFNQSARYCRAWREKGLNERNREIHAREWMLWTERLQGARQLQQYCPAGVWVDTPQVVGKLGHKGAECALNNHNKNPSSPLWGRNRMGQASLTAPCLLFRQGAQKGFLYYDMFTASQTTMCGKRLSSDQIHSFPIL